METGSRSNLKNSKRIYAKLIFDCISKYVWLIKRTIDQSVRNKKQKKTNKDRTDVGDLILDLKKKVVDKLVRVLTGNWHLVGSRQSLLKVDQAEEMRNEQEMAIK